jgi:hypothetical protein
MATIPVSIEEEVGGIPGTFRATWTAMGNADDGAPVGFPINTDRSVYIAGTIASATVVLEGSLDGTNYVTLDDIYGTAISYTSSLPKLEGIGPVTLFVRPRTSGGSGTNINVVVYGVKRRG